VGTRFEEGSFDAGTVGFSAGMTAGFCIVASWYGGKEMPGTRSCEGGHASGDWTGRHARGGKCLRTAGWRLPWQSRYATGAGNMGAAGHGSPYQADQRRWVTIDSDEWPPPPRTPKCISAEKRPRPSRHHKARARRSGPGTVRGGLGSDPSDSVGRTPLAERVTPAARGERGIPELFRRHARAIA